METGGTVTLEKGATVFTVNLADFTDRDEPYTFNNTITRGWFDRARSRGRNNWILTLDDGVVASKMYLGDIRLDTLPLGDAELNRANLGDTLVFGS